MEDACVTEKDLAQNDKINIQKHKTLGYFAVYDGHGGDIVAKHLEKHLHNNVFGSENWKSGEIISAFEESFEKTDGDVIKLENDVSLMTGSTAVVGIIADNTLFTANVGDSEAILILSLIHI
eukprot:TRINITY_DN3637_c0_g3_i1.p1 TRINITY_DN3637_c0_g3~~TRINITY_DN3637_c0_g3_i1.p1  ORF type:complete len:142 (+),score=24.90 TRINITY_DN3637_c0_g3_i1:63-428(+)